MNPIKKIILEILTFVITFKTFPNSYSMSCMLIINSISYFLISSVGDTSPIAGFKTIEHVQDNKKKKLKAEFN